MFQELRPRFSLLCEAATKKANSKLYLNPIKLRLQHQSLEDCDALDAKEHINCFIEEKEGQAAV